MVTTKKVSKKRVTEFSDLPALVEMRIGIGKESKQQGFLQRSISAGKVVRVMATGRNIAKAAIVIGPVIKEFLPPGTVVEPIPCEITQLSRDGGKNFYQVAWILTPTSTLIAEKQEATECQKTTSEK
jgi:hypothetical protein